MFDGPWETCMLVRGLNPSECASWVQAWGTILAIVASVAIVFFVQRSEARRELAGKKAEDIRLLRIVGQFVFDIRAKLRDIEEHDIPYMHRNWTAIDESAACLRNIPFERYPSEKFAFAVATALLSYRFLRDASDKLIEYTLNQSKLQAAHIDRSRQHALDGFFRAEEVAEGALMKRGSELARMQIDFGNGVVIRTLEPDPV